MANKKFDGKIQITERTVRGKNSLAAKVAKNDMKKEGITPLEESQILTESIYNEDFVKSVYEEENPDYEEPYWNR